MSKTTTVVEEYDKDGKLIKKTTTTTEGDNLSIAPFINPYYPPYPWDNPVTYKTEITCNTFNSEDNN